MGDPRRHYDYSSVSEGEQCVAESAQPSQTCLPVDWYGLIGVSAAVGLGMIFIAGASDIGFGVQALLFGLCASGSVMPVYSCKTRPGQWVALAWAGALLFPMARDMEYVANRVQWVVEIAEGVGFTPLMLACVVTGVAGSLRIAIRMRTDVPRGTAWRTGGWTRMLVPPGVVLIVVGGAIYPLSQLTRRQYITGDAWTSVTNVLYACVAAALFLKAIERVKVATRTDRSRPLERSPVMGRTLWQQASRSRAGVTAGKWTLGIVFGSALFGLAIAWMIVIAARAHELPVLTVFGVVAAASAAIVGALAFYYLGKRRPGAPLLIRMHSSLNAGTPRKTRSAIADMAIAAGLPTIPELFVLDNESVNAMVLALNQRRYAIALTRGLVEKLDTSEQRAVAAHLCARIASGDAMLTTTAASIGAYVRLGLWPLGLFALVYRDQAMALLAIVLCLWLMYTIVHGRLLYRADDDALLVLKEPVPLIRALYESAIADNTVTGVPLEQAPLFFSRPGPGWLGASAAPDADLVRMRRVQDVAGLEGIVQLGSSPGEIQAEESGEQPAQERPVPPPGADARWFVSAELPYMLAEFRNEAERRGLCMVGAPLIALGRPLTKPAALGRSLRSLTRDVLRGPGAKEFTVEIPVQRCEVMAWELARVVFSKQDAQAHPTGAEIWYLSSDGDLTRIPEGTEALWPMDLYRVIGRAAFGLGVDEMMPIDQGRSIVSVILASALEGRPRLVDATSGPGLAHALSPPG